MTPAKCCVVGGGGFIGMHVTRQLVATGRDVVVIGRSARPDGLPRQVAYEQGNYGDRSMLRRVLAGAGEVIDLAYATAPQTSFADPIFDVVSNLPASVSLLQESVEAGVACVLLVSSGGTIYGPPAALPILENHVTRPISPYGITKLAIENYGWMFHNLFDLPVIVVRPSNAYGEGQRRLSGQGFIAAAIQRIVAGGEVEIFGKRGTVRDYIHVTDVASGIMAALENGRAGEAYNVGSGEGRSNMEVIKIIEPLASAAGLTIRLRLMPPRKFDVPINYLDSTRLRAVSGWRPQISLEEGVQRLWHAMSTTHGDEA
jgi:UDP-glucose 4-epimerase